MQLLHKPNLLAKDTQIPGFEVTCSSQLGSTYRKLLAMFFVPNPHEQLRERPGHREL